MTSQIGPMSQPRRNAKHLTHKLEMDRYLSHTLCVRLSLAFLSFWLCCICAFILFFFRLALVDGNCVSVCVCVFTAHGHVCVHVKWCELGLLCTLISFSAWRLVILLLIMEMHENRCMLLFSCSIFPRTNVYKC